MTDDTFEQDVLVRSDTTPVVVDLWAPWCGPCRTLGPILEEAVAATDGRVVLVKVDIDENPRISATFAVQSIPAVFALRNRQIVDGFVGAVPRAEVDAFLARIAPPPSEADTLVAAGDEASLRAALELQADHPGAIVALARLLLEGGEADEALALLGRIPETPDTRQLAAEARLARAAGRGGRRRRRRAARRACSIGSRRTTRPARSSSTSSRSLGPDDARTVHTARRWPPACSESGGPSGRRGPA